MTGAVRLAHVSDVHVTARPRLTRPGEWLGKRLTGYAAGVATGRRAGFRQAAKLCAAFAADAADRPPDAVVFTGDATALALPAEFAAARRALGVTGVGVAVPGNHDVYTAGAARAGAFEAAFGPWQRGERVGGFAYPFAVPVGGVWLVAVNSARPNRKPLDATGEIGAAQLDRLRTLCARLGPGPRFVVTHYPLRAAGGGLERPTRRLVDHAAALEAAVACGVAAWLHGHVHAGYFNPPTPEVPVPQVCAGSLTQAGRRAYCEYTVSGGRVEAVRRVSDPATGGFRDAGRFGFACGNG